MQKTTLNKTGDISSLQEFAERLARQSGEAIIAFTHGVMNTVTVGELDKKAQYIAQVLLSLGVNKDSCVSLYSRNSVHWIAGCLGIFRAGATVVPIDSQLSGKELEHIILDSGSEVVMTDAAGVDTIKKVRPTSVIILLERTAEAIPDTLYWEDVRIGTSDGRASRVSAHDRAALFYTSGTTGQPKGVPLTHANLIFQLQTIERSGIVRKGFRVLQPLPVHHVYPFVTGILAPLALECTLILPESLTGPKLLRAIKEGRARVMIGVPRLYQAMLQGIEGKRGLLGYIKSTFLLSIAAINRLLRRLIRLNAGRIFLYPLHRKIGTSLRILTSGGAPLDPEVEKRLYGYGWDLAIGYGLTETSPLLTIKFSNEDKIGSVGRPVSETKIRIDTSVVRQKHPSGTGEVLAHGPGVFSGYHHLRKETEDVLTKDSWFRTGDLGYLDKDNYLFLVGRRSTLIVLPGGENVQPETVEQVYSADPVIREIGVFLHTDRLVALIVPDQEIVNKIYNGNMNIAISGALHHQAQKVPSYMHLAEYAVLTAAIPRTQLGKIRRHLLPELYESALEQKAKGPRQKGAMPIDQMLMQDRELLRNLAAKKAWFMLERRFRNVWLTPDTDLRSGLSVDSLMWISLTFDIQQETGVELSEESLTRAWTVRELLQEIARGGQGKISSSLESIIEHPEENLSQEQMSWLYPLNIFQRIMRYFGYLLVAVALKVVFRLRVFGRENIPEQGPIVFAPNHPSHIDPLAVAVALEYRRLSSVYWAGWAGIMLRDPFMRLITRLSQTVPVQPGRSVSSSLAYGSLLLKQDKKLVWFPEGERSPTGEFLPLRPGLGILLSEIDAVVVPVWIEGTFEALPRGRIIPRMHRISVRFGTPFRPSLLREETRSKEELRQRILQELRDRLQQLKHLP
ncbi:MAG: hypothetical protein A2X42_00980 [Candidatus Margulisbacteria bacterium GWF2_38_17]|nr:MAG: hypothetical protein A2X42_00980 [Candidatus Margulisbacteria bacterium GWF2_38_17]OGI11091.1 MAG: hypothetical protein A2X41_02275 [Candidatus Margulisbacteria bacterium GWE2_39_32]